MRLKRIEGNTYCDVCFIELAEFKSEETGECICRNCLNEIYDIEEVD